MNDVLHDVARTRRSIVTTADLVELGMTKSAIRHEVQAGRLIRLVRGTYAPTDRLRSPESRHLVRAQARCTACGPQTVLTHHSAALAYGLPAYGADLATIHLGRPGASSRWRSPGLVVHALPMGVPTSRDDDVPRVGAAYAVVQVGLLNGPRAAVAAADAALRAGLATASELGDAVAAFRRRHAIEPVRRAVAMADGRAESPGESVLRYDLRLSGHRTEVQPTVIVAGSTFRPDLRILGTTVLVEFDGLAKYDDPSELRRERSREAALRNAGWEVVRFQWSDLEDVPLISARMRTALARAGARGGGRRAV